VGLQLVEALLGLGDASSSRTSLREQLVVLVSGDEVLLRSDFDAGVQSVDLRLDRFGLRKLLG
jgi:hypothetical protein